VKLSIEGQDKPVKVDSLGDVSDAVKQVLQLWTEVIDAVADIASQEPKNKEAVLNLADLWLKFNKLQKPLEQIHQLQTESKLSAADIKSRLAFLKSHSIEKVPLIDLIHDSLPT